MSRSEPTIKNPATNFFQWSGKKGVVTYYDKEKQENVEVRLPFVFLVLDRLSTITGFCKPDDSGYWSNEVYSTKKDILTVRTKKGIKAQGLYEEVKNLKGAKYTQSLYIAIYNEEKQLVIANLKLAGAALSEWIDFTKGRDIFQGGIRIISAVEKTNGDNTFFAPVFDAFSNVSQQANDAANKLDQELKVYLKAYFAMQGQDQSADSDNGYDGGGAAGESSNGAAGFPDNPIAKSLTDLVTVKQLGMIRALARENGIDPDEECQKVMNARTDELSKKAASAFIGYLQEMNGETQPFARPPADQQQGSDWKSSLGNNDFSNPDDEDLPF